MIFGDGTHSKGDPRHCTLDFYTKVQVWGEDGENLIMTSIHTKDHLGKKYNNDDSSILLKKEREEENKKNILKEKRELKKVRKENDINIYIKKKRRSRKMGAPPLNLCCYHQGP